MTLRQRSSAGGTPVGNDESPSSSTPLAGHSHEKRETNSYIHNLLLAKLFRFLGKIGFLWHTWCLTPRGAGVSRSERIRVRDGQEITLRIYDPSSSSRISAAAAASPAGSASAGRGCIVNFHGGGWTIGSATDDARWARWLVDAGYKCISVEYRLAPKYPWPTAVHDCADATRHVIEHAERYGVDREKVMTSGFSAGGSLAVTTALALAHPDQLDPSSSAVPLDPIRLRGVVGFYPLLDFSTPRPAKVSRSKRPDILKPLPGWMTRMFDSSYLPPPSAKEPDKVIDRTHPLISPLLAPDTQLADFPNTHLCLCEADVLAQEGQEFADRLNTLKQEVTCRWVERARHGWDKPPHPVNQSVKDEYDAAVQSITRWCA